MIRLVFVLGLFIGLESAYARVTFSTQCHVNGTQSCLQQMEHRLLRDPTPTGSPTCTERGSAAAAQQACEAHQAEVEQAAADRDQANADRDIINQRTVILERRWQCDGNGPLKPSMEFTIETKKIPTSPTSDEYETEYRRRGNLTFDCGGAPAFLSFTFQEQGTGLADSARSSQCQDNGDPLAVTAQIPMGNGQPQTPIQMSGSANGESYPMDLTSCNFAGSSVSVGDYNRRQLPGHENIQTDSVPVEVVN